MPKKTIDALEGEIENARLEIGALQKRLSEMLLRRKMASQFRDGREAHEKSWIKNDPRILRIDLQLAKAREAMRDFPDHAKSIQVRIATLETERYRLLLVIDED